MNKVELIYNPYQEKCRILINGNSISEYSQLANYLQESFEIWSPKILKNIEQELNDEFELEIVSDEFHSWILNEIANVFESCTSVSQKIFPINHSVSERLNNLMELDKGKSDNTDIHVLIFSREIMLTAFAFGELCKSGKYEVQQSVLYLHNKKITCIVTSDISIIEQKKVDLAICIEQEKENVLETIEFVNNHFVSAIHWVGVEITEKLAFVGLQNNGYYFLTDILHLSELLDKTIEYLAIVPYIKKRKAKIEDSCNVGMFDSKQKQLQFQLIDAVEPLIMAYCESELEEGCFMPIEFTTFPENVQLPQMSVRISNPAILSYSEGKLYGILDGETDIEISVSGSIQPIYRKHIRVKRIIRITNLYIEHPSIILKQGTKYKIEYCFEPKDADNIEDIEWSSTNSHVANIISKGYIECLNVGTCDIVVKAENVVERCRVCVKPEMKKIMLPMEKVTLTMGQVISFVPDYEPKNCFDSTIFVETENPKIVVFEKGKLISKGLGSTYVTFWNAEKTVKSVAEIVVESTLYVSEKSNIYKMLSFIMAVVSIFLLMLNKAYGLVGVVIGIVLGVLAVMKDYENVEGIVNVRGEPMQPDCFGSVLFIVMNIVICIFAMMN